MTLRASRWLALAVAVALVAGGAIGALGKYPKSGRSTIAHAYNLVQHGVFSRAVRQPDSVPDPGRAMPAGYPAVVAVVAFLNADAHADMGCYRHRPPACRTARPFAALMIPQILAGIGILVLVCLIALEVSGSHLVAYASVIAFERGARLGEYSVLVRPESFANLLLFAATLMVLLAYRKRRTGWLAAAGATFGSAAYFNATAPFLVFAVPIAMAAFLYLRSSDPALRRLALFGGFAFLLSGVAVMAPWALRNWLLFGDPMLHLDNDMMRIATRVAYNAMTLPEIAAAFVHWLPTLGNDVTQFLMAPDLTAKLGFSAPETYYKQGRVLGFELRARIDGGQNPVGQVWREHIAGDPWSYLATIPVLAWRGLWGTHSIVALLGLAGIGLLIRSVAGTPRRLSLSLLAAVAIVMLFVNSLISPNFYWDNPLMLLIFAISVGNGFRYLVSWLDRRFFSGDLPARSALS